MILSAAGIYEDNLDNVGELLMENGPNELPGLAVRHLNRGFSPLSLFLLRQISQVPILLPLPPEVVLEEEAHKGEEPVESLTPRVVNVDRRVHPFPAHGHPTGRKRRLLDFQ